VENSCANVTKGLRTVPGVWTCTRPAPRSKVAPGNVLYKSITFSGADFFEPWRISRRLLRLLVKTEDMVTKDTEPSDRLSSTRSTGSHLVHLLSLLKFALWRLVHSEYSSKAPKICLSWWSFRGATQKPIILSSSSSQELLCLKLPYFSESFI
jgi:hypothetical protein